MIKLALSLIASLLITIAVFSLAESFSAFAFTRRAQARLTDFTRQEEERLPPFIERIFRERAKWFEIVGISPAKVAASLMPFFIVAAAAFLFGLFARNFIVLASSLLLAMYPLFRVRAKANEIKEKIVRDIPVAASLIAAFFSVIPSAEEAIVRVKDLPGPLGQFLTRVLVEAKKSGKPLFSRGETGALLEAVRAYKCEPLTAFFAQLDQVANAGTGGITMMLAIADALQKEYKVRLSEMIEALDNNLVLPTTIFFFLPFVAGILLPMILGLMEML